MCGNTSRWLLACVLGAGVLLAAGAGRVTPAAAAQGKGGKIIPIKVDRSGPTKADGELTKDISLDKDGKPFQAYSFAAKKGFQYRFELTTTAFDPFVRLEDVKGTTLKSEDDSSENASRMLYRATADGTLHFIATTYARGGTGKFSITITASETKAPTVVKLALEAAKPARVESKLTTDDGTDHQGKHCKAYEFKAEQGKLYRFSATAKNARGLNGLLRVEDAQGKIVAHQNRGGDGTSLLLFRPNQDDTFRLIVSHFGPPPTAGDFVLTAAIVEASEPKAAAVPFETVKQARTADTLGEHDALDPDGRYQKAFAFKAEAGKTYRVELAAKQFPPRLLIQDATGNTVKQGGNFNPAVSLVYRAEKAGDFRVVVTSEQVAGGGEFTLTVTEAVARTIKPVTLKFQPGTPTRVAAALTDDDATDDQGREFRDYVFEAEAGKVYRIDLHSKAFDAYLYLKDANYKTLAKNDDNGEDGSLDARIVYKIEKAGKHHVIATTLRGGTGPFVLTVAEPTGLDRLQAEALDMFRWDRDVQQQFADRVAKFFADQKGELGQQAGRLAKAVARELEFTDKKLAAEVYTRMGKALAGSKDAEVAKQGRLLVGTGKRLMLVGQTMPVKGKTTDGKEFDLANLKGKVVLVDFWATWSGPCVAAVPNIQRLYDRYHKDGFEVIGISLDDDPAPLTKFIADRKMPWPTIYDRNNGTGQELAEAYGVSDLPLAILVGPDGRVVSTTARGDELDRLLRDLLEKK
jgi:thiol-disulfide isomerase/thioredoxin